ncbi:MAG: HAMP domain-containing protein, partial [Dethiobacteria bacterium]|nr:HAMP domain-containing protein [Dethiobacteria bacterium]
MNLKIKLVLLFLAIGLIPVAVVGLISYTIASNNIEAEVVDKLDLYANIKSQDLQDYFQARVKDGRVIATTRDVYQSLYILQGGAQQGAVIGEVGDTTDPMWQARVAIMNDLLTTADREYGYEFTFITDSNGICVFSTNPEVLGADLSGRDYIQGSLSGNSTWSELFFSTVINENALVISTPVYSGGTSGDIVGTFNILFSDTIISAVIHDGLDAIGQSADGYLVRSDFTMLSNMRFGDFASGAALVEKMQSEATEPLVEPIQAGNFDFHEIKRYTNYLGNPVIGSLKVSLLGNEAVGFVVQVNQAEVFAGVNNMRTLMLIIIAVSLVAIIVLGFMIANNIAKPVQQVAEVAGQIAGGDFTVETKIKRKDEIGQLAQAFNTMSESLRALISTAVEMSTGVNSGSESVSAASE